MGVQVLQPITQVKAHSYAVSNSYFYLLKNISNIYCCCYALKQHKFRRSIFRYPFHLTAAVAKVVQYMQGFLSIIVLFPPIEIVNLTGISLLIKYQLNLVPLRTCKLTMMTFKDFQNMNLSTVIKSIKSKIVKK